MKVLDYDGLDHSLAKLKAYLDAIRARDLADADAQTLVLSQGIAVNSARLQSIEDWLHEDERNYVDCITLGGVTYLPQNGGIALPGYPTMLPASDVYEWAKKASLDVNDIPSITTGKISDLETWISNKGFVTSAVNNLANYYLKSQTYTQAEVNTLIAAINQFRYEIAASTSAVADPQPNVLYLIGPVGSGSDRYEEYVYPNDTTGWTKIGDTSIDLTGYVNAIDYGQVAETPVGFVSGVSKASGSGTIVFDFTNIYGWALASTKPSYTFSEIGSKPDTLVGYGINDVYFGAHTADSDRIPITLGLETQNVLIAHQSLSGYVNAISPSAETDVYPCPDCDYFYDPAIGDPIGGIAAGTAFADLPSDWVCPICGASKADFTVGGRQFVSGVIKSPGSSTISFTLNRLALRDLSGANNLKAIEYASGSGLLKKNDDGTWGFEAKEDIDNKDGVLAAGIAANSSRLDSLEYWVNRIDARLLTPRTIWGQAFDGSANITGAMTGVSSIDALMHFDTSNGRIGIGITTPQYNLDVSGTFRAAGNSEIGGDLNVGGGLTVPQYSGLNFGGASDVWLASLGIDQYGSSLILSFGADDDHVVLHDGNYGVYMIPLSEGIASISARLDSMENWLSNPRFSSLVADRLDSDEISVGVLTATSLACAALSGVGNVNSKIYFSGANVGIANSSPSYGLDVSGTFRATGNAVFEGSIEAVYARALLYSIQSSPVEWDTEATPVIEIQPFEISEAGNAAFEMVSVRDCLRLRYYNRDEHDFSDSDISFDGDHVLFVNPLSAPRYDTSSDQRLKTNLSPVALTVEQIASAPVVEFNWVGNGQRGAGSIAQYWEEQLPYNVHRNGDLLTMEYGNIALISAIVCAREIQKLEARIKELESKLNS